MRRHGDGGEHARRHNRGAGRHEHGNVVGGDRYIERSGGEALNFDRTRRSTKAEGEKRGDESFIDHKSALWTKKMIEVSEAEAVGAAKTLDEQKS